MVVACDHLEGQRLQGRKFLFLNHIKMYKISRSFGPMLEAQLILLLWRKTGEEGLLDAQADEDLVVLEEEVALVGEGLLLVEGHQGAGGGAAVGDEEHVVFGVDEAVDGAHPDGLDGQVGVVLVVA